MHQEAYARLILSIDGMCVSCWESMVPPCADDDVGRKTEQPYLLATVQARRLSQFGYIARMSDESDAILTASPWRTGGDHRDTPVLRG